MSYFQMDDSSLSFNAAKQKAVQEAIDRLKSLNVYIMVFIPALSPINEITSMLKVNGLLDFPYYWIGVDSWFQEARYASSIAICISC